MKCNRKSVAIDSLSILIDIWIINTDLRIDVLIGNTETLIDVLTGNTHINIYPGN